MRDRGVTKQRKTKTQNGTRGPWEGQKWDGLIKKKESMQASPKAKDK
jgi:hypothetical protein